MTRHIKHLQMLGAIAALGMLPGPEHEPIRREPKESAAHQALREDRKERRARERQAKRKNRK